MDNRYGDRDNSWRDREDSGYGRHRDYGRGNRGAGHDERGFMDRAGDEVRSWFGDDEAERRRERDERRWEREQGMTGRRENQAGEHDYSAGYRGTSAGWGNQSGDSWNRDRPGTHGSYGAYGAGGERERSSSSWGNESSRRYGEPSRDSNWGAASNSRYRDHSGSTGARDRDAWETPSRDDDDSDRGYGGGSTRGAGGGGADTWGGSGFGGPNDTGRRFDRVDPGHVGAQGAHPMSAPVGGGYGGTGGVSASGGYTSSARAYAAERQSSGQGGHDPHYSEWRSRQVESLDRDYDEYRREHQSKFEEDFKNWRTRRGEQRQHMGRVTEHMEVIGSDGEKIGTVDAVHGDRIILTKSDENAGGHQHSIPCSWIEEVEDKVIVNRSQEQAVREWRDEERSRALFEREDSGSSGPHMLNRSFSGTY